MVYGAKNNKPSNSTNPDHKRRISLLNADFKIITGTLNLKLKSISTHTLNPNQLAVGDDRRIHHGINKARDAINAACNKNEGVGILDNDYKAAFDYMVLTWVLKVLEAKGLDREVIHMILNLYNNNMTVVVVNNIQGGCYLNNRWSIRQGDRPSSILFCFGLDPLLDWLEARLRGIPIYTSNFFSPASSTEVYKLIAYVDDVKPSVTSMQEFNLIDKGSALFEAASGCMLHRDPSSGKVKFLPLGRWKGTLEKEDIPVKYIALAEHLDMVGVKLKPSFIQSRKLNCDEVQEKVNKVVSSWKSGKFMPLSLRSHSINSYCLSKVWFRCPSVNLRGCDSEKITTTLKSWLFQDQLLKPEDFVLYRPRHLGGLGLVHVKTKALALQIRSFMESAVNPKFRRNIYHEALFKWHIEQDRSIPNPGTPPFYPESFFTTIKEVEQEGLLNIKTLDTAGWYRALLENNVTHVISEEGIRSIKLCRVEIKNPDVDWERAWSLAITPGLSSEQTSFIWKMIHDLLPTRERLFRMNLPDILSPACDLCPQGAPDNVEHALLLCPYNEASNYTLGLIQNIIPTVQPSQAVLFDLDISPDQQLPVTFILSTCLSLVWKNRRLRKQCSPRIIRAELEAGVQIMRKSRYHDAANKVLETISEVDL